MAKEQRHISVSEFFAKNRHLLGFDNKRKALLMTVKEAVFQGQEECDQLTEEYIDEVGMENFQVFEREYAHADLMRFGKCLM